MSAGDCLDEKVRERAYELWETAGRPEGQGDAFWHQAWAELAPFPDEDSRLDKTLEDSFPASDPPSYMGTT
jgi:hypothetical protein